MLKKPLISLFILCSIIIGSADVCLPYNSPRDSISAKDETYLNQLMKDTWTYISFFVMPKTGFPLDSNVRSRLTNTTNIGLYLASVAVAHRLGYIKTDDALNRAMKILDSLDKIENWDGLYNNWLDVYGDTKARPGPNNISDYNKLPAGIILIRQEFPELKARCGDFLDRIPWQAFYDSNTGKLFYEFDVVKRNTLNPVFISRGEDKLLASFLAIGSRKVPPISWENHLVLKESMYGLDYFSPGWQGGGLFMQFICGLFLDERGTKLGYSSANFAYAQITHAKTIDYPVWGWSACQAPDGRYLGMDQIIDDVVTPHASVLAIGLFPKEVLNNLKELEKLGCRKPYKAQDREFAFGFKDSVNLKTNEVCPNYLLLDQAMIFLSLANFLEDDVVRRMFANDPIVRYGLKVIPDYNLTRTDRQSFYDYLDSLRSYKPE